MEKIFGILDVGTWNKTNIDTSYLHHLQIKIMRLLQCINYSIKVWHYFFKSDRNVGDQGWTDRVWAISCYTTIPENMHASRRITIGNLPHSAATCSCHRADFKLF